MTIEYDFYLFVAYHRFGKFIQYQIYGNSYKLRTFNSERLIGRAKVRLQSTRQKFEFTINMEHIMVKKYTSLTIAGNPAKFVW